MALITRTDKGSKLSIAEMDGNLNFLHPSMNLRYYTDLDKLHYEFNAFSGIKIMSDSGTAEGSNESGYDLTALPSDIPGKIIKFTFNPSFKVTSLTGFNLLTGLKDIGTASAMELMSNSGFTATMIDTLFTQLPSTTNTATIKVNFTPGASGCTPSIATAKGYTVVT